MQVRRVFCWTPSLCSSTSLSFSAEVISALLSISRSKELRNLREIHKGRPVLLKSSALSAFTQLTMRHAHTSEEPVIFLNHAKHVTNIIGLLIIQAFKVLDNINFF